jgi:hypothetical protein
MKKSQKKVSHLCNMHFILWTTFSNNTRFEEIIQFAWYCKIILVQSNSHKWLGIGSQINRNLVSIFWDKTCGFMEGHNFTICLLAEPVEWSVAFAAWLCKSLPKWNPRYAICCSKHLNLPFKGPWCRSIPLFGGTPYWFWTPHKADGWYPEVAN